MIRNSISKINSLLKLHEHEKKRELIIKLRCRLASDHSFVVCNLSRAARPPFSKIQRKKETIVIRSFFKFFLP